MSEIFQIIEGLQFPDKRKVVFEFGVADADDTPKIMSAVDPAMKGIDYYGFEPDPRNVELIRKSPVMTMEGFHLIQAAIGGHTMRREFMLSDGFNTNLNVPHTFSSSLKRPAKHLHIHPWCTFDKSIQVPVMRLDDFCRLYSIDEIDFIWCDIQGAEDLFISGSRAALCHTRYLYTEYYNEEVYENQIGLSDIHARLPGEWNIVKAWESDVLFANQMFK